MKSDLQGQKAMQNYNGCAQMLSWGEVAELPPFRGSIPEDRHHVC